MLSRRCFIFHHASDRIHERIEAALRQLDDRKTWSGSKLQALLRKPTTQAEVNAWGNSVVLMAFLVAFFNGNVASGW